MAPRTTADLVTPALVVDAAAFDHNIATMTAALPGDRLRPHVKAATWVGNRRWNLTFDTNEVLELPEDNAAAALVKFAELDGRDRLLGRGFLRFDMRDPSRMVIRKPDATTSTTSVSEDSPPRPAVYDGRAGGRAVAGIEQG